MSSAASIIVAGIGAVAAITGSFFAAQAAADTRVNAIDKQVVEIKTTQELQYTELKGLLERQYQEMKVTNDKLDRALRD